MSKSINSNIRNVGLLELAHHNEVLRSYALTFTSNPQLTVTIFSTTWVFEQSYDIQNKASIKWILSKENQKTSHFLKEQKINLQLQDLIILITNEDQKGKLIELNNDLPHALVLHDLHTHFAPFNNLLIDKRPRHIGMELGRLIRFLLFKRKKLRTIVKMADYLFLPSSTVLKYAKSEYSHCTKFKCLPFATNDEISRAQKGQGPIQITIPGSITDKSRDYQIVVEALANLNSDLIHLVLLGKPIGLYGRSVLKKFGNLKNIKVKSYLDFVPQNEFDSVMRSTDFLILPLNKKMKFGVVGELNGHSCSSGNINDMIRYGIPAILPSYYPLQKELEEVTLTYNSQPSLTNAIQNWLDRKKINRIKTEKMPISMTKFSKTAALKTLFSQLNF